MAKIGFIEVDITADVSHLRAGLASASSLIRDFSLLSMGLTAGISSAFEKISTIGIRAVQIGLLGITGTLVGATIEGSNFGHALNKTFSILGTGAKLAAKDMELLRDRAKQLGRDTLFSATEAAEGMSILARSGFDTKQIIEAIAPVLELAVAKSMDMATVADMVVSALKGFGLAAEDAGHIADVMAVATAKSNTTMQNLYDSLSYVAPLAKAVGWSVEETGAALMMLHDAGIKGSKAATGLRGAFAYMLGPTKQTKELAKDLGVEFVTSSGKLRDFGAILTDLGFSGIEISHIFKIFKRRSAASIEVLRSQGKPVLDKFTKMLENSGGAAHEAGQKLREDFQGRVTDLIASIKGLGIEIFESYEKPLTSATFSLRNVVKAITDAIKETGIFKNIVSHITAIIDSFGITQEGITKKIIAFIESFTPEKISIFFENFRKKLEETKERISNVLIPAIKGVWNELKVVGEGIKNAFAPLLEWWSKLSDSTKIFITKLMILGGTFLWLVGGLTPIILLFITLSSIISALVHVHIAAAITKSLVYAKALMVLKGVAIGVGWALGIVGAAIAGWKIGEWIGNLKLFSDEITTVNDIVTDWFTNMIVGWRVFIANFKLGALKIRQIFDEYLIGPLNALQKVMTLGLAPEIKPFEGLTEAIRSAAMELESARVSWHETGRELERQREARRVGLLPAAGVPIEPIPPEKVREVREDAKESVEEATEALKEEAILDRLLNETFIRFIDGVVVATNRSNERNRILKEELEKASKKIIGEERETGHFIGNQLPGEVE